MLTEKIVTEQKQRETADRTVGGGGETVWVWRGDGERPGTKTFRAERCSC